jgi:hypothetical protein
MKVIQFLDWIFHLIPDWVYGKKWFGGLILAFLLGYALSQANQKVEFIA